MRRTSGIGVVRRELDELAARLALAVPSAARPGADLVARTRRRMPWPATAPLLRAADGWVHPGPVTSWSAFVDMVVALGAARPLPGSPWPQLEALTVDELDAEAAMWRLPAAVVRSAPSTPDPVPDPASATVGGATVVVIGTAWATPLVGRVLSDLGARVLKIEHPRRPDPFPLRDDLVRGQEVHAVDLDTEPDRSRCAAVVDLADLLVLGHPPRILANAGITPRCSVLQLAAFADDDRPGYGPAAEAHGGWAARHEPPRLGRTSVADPVAGLTGAVTAVDLLTAGRPGARARVSLEGAVGRLLDRERRGG